MVIFMESISKLDIETIKKISASKGEPKWMLEFRLKSLENFN